MVWSLARHSKQTGEAAGAAAAAPADGQNAPAPNQVLNQVEDKDGGLPAAALAAVKAHLLDDGSPDYTEDQLLLMLGLSLLLGFVFMLLVDQLAGASHSHRGAPLSLGILIGSGRC